jgi:hypothetical protein
MDEQEALAELRHVKDSYRRFIRDNFESAAQDCGTCPTFGDCCTDAHFVNVHITRLEAVAIRETLNQLPESAKQTVYERIANTIEKYKLKDDGDTFDKTYACPLFEPKIGCLVHTEAKPAPCIQHACYERAEDLPPQCLQDNAERKIERLNQNLYGEDWCWLPLPVQLTAII